MPGKQYTCQIVADEKHVRVKKEEDTQPGTNTHKKDTTVSIVGHLINMGTKRRHMATTTVYLRTHNVAHLLLLQVCTYCSAV